jgi:hypothetical protein
MSDDDQKKDVERAVQRIGGYKPPVRRYEHNNIRRWLSWDEARDLFAVMQEIDKMKEPKDGPPEVA